MRIISWLVLVLVIAASSLISSEAAELPPDAQKIADKADAAIAAIRKTSDEQIAKIALQEVKDLQRLHDAAEKKGDHPRAAAIKQRIDEVTASGMASSATIANGQKIAFLGDSITWLGWRSPTGYVQKVVSGLQANGITVTPIPTGKSGNKSNDMLARLDADVLSHKPDWMTLSCGVNDVWHGDKGVPLDKYQENITAILDKAQAAGVRVMILTATMIGEDAPNANNQKLVEYNDFLRAIAKKRGLPLADLNADMQAAITNGKVVGRALTSDGVHMNPAGDQMMALGILRAFGLGKPMLAKAEAAWTKP